MYPLSMLLSVCPMRRIPKTRTMSTQMVMRRMSSSNTQTVPSLSDKSGQGQSYLRQLPLMLRPTVFPDWSAPNVTQWWKDSFHEYRKIAKYDGVWLDMNEPANFNTTDQENLSGVKYEANLLNEPPYEIHNGEGKLGWRTMWPDVKRADGARHYNVHNMYGYE
jgi:alpha-glucosidase (family GH31 glycosyl hydrolase)